MEEHTPTKESAEKFLERDFNQCFTQMRHYDGQIVEIVKFTFTAYTALIGVAVGLYQFSKKESVDLIPVAQAILFIGFFFGLFMLLLATRNRVYFVVLARYINEHRRLFLKNQPLGFQNSAGMYVSPTHPRYFNWQSSQVVYLYLIATLNAILLAALLATISGPRWPSIVGFLVSLTVQLLSAIIYLRCREGKSADHVVHGKRDTESKIHLS